jgi:hypothetical protein
VGSGFPRGVSFVGVASGSPPAFVGLEVAQLRAGFPQAPIFYGSTALCWGRWSHLVT